MQESEGVVGPGEALIELGNTREVEVEVEVLSVDAVKMAPGTEVELVRWGGEKPLVGRVRVVEPSGFTKISALGVEEQRVNVVVALDEIPPGLGDNYRVEAKLLVWSGENVLTVPKSAVFRQRDRWAVYALEEGQAKLRLIEIGHRGRLEVEVSSGLSEGDTVVLYPGDRVSEGLTLEPRPER